MASLRGKAMLHLQTLPPPDDLTLLEFMTSLEQEFGKKETREALLAELTARRQKLKESYKELGNCIRRLVRLAYPTLLKRMTICAFGSWTLSHMM